MLEYKSWSVVPHYLKTKIKLEKLGLRPIHDLPDATVQVYEKHGFRKHYLYDIDKCTPLNNPRVPQDSSDVCQIEITTENLAESLYVVNKFAKRIRDQKKNNYEQRQYEDARFSKNKEQQLYQLKEKVIAKMFREGRAKIIGIHKQTVNDKFDGEWENHLLLIEIGEFEFHRPAKKKDVEKYPYLGEIDIVSAEKNKITRLSLAESRALLEKYLKN